MADLCPQVLETALDERANHTQVLQMQAEFQAI
jgi:hypothetical protein